MPKVNISAALEDDLGPEMGGLDQWKFGEESPEDDTRLLHPIRRQGAKVVLEQIKGDFAVDFNPEEDSGAYISIILFGDAIITISLRDLVNEAMEVGNHKWFTDKSMLDAAQQFRTYATELEHFVAHRKEMK